MTYKKKLQVFISSTYTDLQKERQIAVEAVLTAGHIPAGMELFAAGDESQMDVIKRWIDESDVYLLILGGHYGTIEPNSKKSYIQLEYEYALERGKPLFALVITENLLDKRAREFGATVYERENPREMKEFRDLVMSKIVRFWDDPRDIRVYILETMSEFSRRGELVGWVPGSELANAVALAEESERLSQELGVSTPLKTIKHQTALIIKNSQIYARSDVGTLHEPLCFDSNRACIRAYCEALDLVTKRFWTTTYMSSEFWTQDSPEILDANTRMLERVRAERGDIRRIFLLDQPTQKAVDTWRQGLINSRIQGDIQSKRWIRSKLHNLKRNFDALKKEGCQVKVVFDDNAHQMLRQMNFTPGDSEIAIYDNFRVDVFGGGRIGRIADIAIYSKATSSFNGILNISQNYFEALWRQGESAEEYLDRLEEADQLFEKQMDYTPHWLAKYEFDLSRNDEELKVLEIRRVEEILKRQNISRWGHINRYLDVGTCTGRYPIQLREAVVKDGKIIGIDSDPQCISFAGGRVREKAGGDRRIDIQQIDFGAREIPDIGKFDLITCMLGTLSHFGWGRNQEFDDLLQHVLRRMADLLTEGGILILGIWSEYACKNRHMLGIYHDGDRQRLAQWTPGTSELKKRLDHAGLTFLHEDKPENRLDMFTYQKVPKFPIIPLGN
jgi:SAM-dependent methyltransferase